MDDPSGKYTGTREKVERTDKGRGSGKDKEKGLKEKEWKRSREEREQGLGCQLPYFYLCLLFLVLFLFCFVLFLVIFSVISFGHLLVLYFVVYLSFSADFVGAQGRIWRGAHGWVVASASLPGSFFLI